MTMKWIMDLIGKMFRDSVSKEVCTEIQKKNAMVTCNLDGCIEGAIKTAASRFTELKADMQRGFDEVKDLIKERR